MATFHLFTRRSVVLLWLSSPILAQGIQVKEAPGSRVSPASSFAAESIDLDMYSRIRDEGFNHSRVMEYAGALVDDIGARLTGSPAMRRANEWTRDQLEAVGCSNAHLESWGEFGLSWTQGEAALALVRPSSSVFSVQATPWSPATPGPVTADVIYVRSLTHESEFLERKGKLKGKVILYGQGGQNAKMTADTVPEMHHFGANELESIAQYPLNGDMSAQDVPSVDQIDQLRTAFMKAYPFRERVAAFFAEEGAVAILVPGGAGGVLSDDNRFSMGRFVFRPEHRQAIPEEVIATEAWERMLRLIKHSVPVTVRLDIATHFNAEHEQGYNTIAEIPGTDPALKGEVVMVGGHLDSWAAGTGATDNGAGAVTAMEAIRILKALHVQPRRTIRIALWSGEEQGLFGSFAYVSSHFADFHYAGPMEDELPKILQQMSAPPTLKDEGRSLDAYFNMDNGTGKLLGVYTEGNEGAGSIFAQWIQPLKDLGVTTISERRTGSTDHVSFQIAGLSGFQFIQDPRDYEERTHHTALDTFEHLSEPDLKQAAIVEAIFLYNTAMRDAMLPRPSVPLVMSKQPPLQRLYPSTAK